MIAHLGGVPAEETLLPLVSGVSTVVLVTHAWLAVHLRRPRRP